MGQTEPGDREEMLLQGILNGDTTTNIEPGSREEALLAGILRGDTETNIEPGSRKEAFLKAILENGGGGSHVEVNPLTVTTNGTYTAEEGKAYDPVEVDVQPNLKDVKIISENGTYTASYEGYDGYAEVEVEVNTPGPAQFVSSGTIASPDANVTSGNLIAAALADHKYFELSFVFGENTYVFPVQLDTSGTGRAYLIGVGGGEVLMGFVEYSITNLQLSLQTIFLARMNTDGTGFVDMTSMLPTTTPATITGYYW